MKSESEKFRKAEPVKPGHMSEFHPLVNRDLYLYEVRIERNKEFVIAQADGALQVQVGCQLYEKYSSPLLDCTTVANPYFRISQLESKQTSI